MDIEMNMDCHEYLPVLAEFLGFEQQILEDFYTALPDIPRWGGGTVEPAVAQMLYIITRALEPRSALEFGTNLGYSTAFIARALLDNHLGFLDTWDIDTQVVKEALEHLDQLAISHRVASHIGDTTQDVDKQLKTHDVQLDLVFIDSSHQYEATKIEIATVLKYMKSGVILFHDAVSPISGVTTVLKEMEEQGIYDILTIPTQPNTGFGIIMVR